MKTCPHLTVTAVAALLFLLAVGPVVADRIHLTSGGTIDVSRWWVEGDELVYEGPAGTVAIPRSLVRAIEPSGGKDSPATGTGAAEAGSTSQPREATTAEAGSSKRDAAKRPVPRNEVERRFLDASDALSRRDYEAAAEGFLAVIERAPKIPSARVGYAVAEMARERDNFALPVVLEGLSLTPNNADLHEILGDLRDREEWVEEAVREWREAFRLAPNDRLRQKLLRAERELQAGRDYTFSATAHFNVRHDGELDPDLGAEITDYLETRFRDLTDELRHAPSQPITVLLYPEQAFRDVTQAPDRVGGLYDGKIRVPLGGIHRLNPKAKALLTHELTHAVVYSKTHGNCPRWLQEGLAQRFEGRTLGPAQIKEIRALLRSRGAEHWETRDLSYPAALSLALYLENRTGFDRVVELLDRLGRGETVDQALQYVYRLDYAQLCRDWAGSVLEEPER